MAGPTDNRTAEAGGGAHPAGLAGPRLTVTGLSGAGKTTFLERLVAEFVGRGLRPLAIKRMGAGYALDAPGKDSRRLYDAGAAAAAYHDGEWLLHGRGPLDAGAAMGLAGLDATLLEGFKAGPGPRVVALHPELGAPSGLGWEEAAGGGGLPGTLAWIAPTEAEAARIREAGLPAFQRDRAAGAADFLLPAWRRWALAEAPLAGAVLAGGRGRRMGRDKGALDLGAGPEALRLLWVLRGLGLEDPVLAAAEAPWPPAPGAPAVADRLRGFGPAGAVAGLLMERPGRAWMALACDLPGAGPALAAWLRDNRDPLRLATVPTAGGRPQPLAAVYEPRALPRLMRRIAEGRLDLRGLAAEGAVHTPAAPPELEREFTNLNTPEDLERWRLGVPGVDPSL